MDDEKDEGPLILTHFGKRLAELAEIRKGACILDLGMGGGTSLIPAAKRVGTTGQVFGIDISHEMIRYSYEKIKDLKIPNARLIQTDAKNLIFKDNTFDCVLSGFSYIYSTLEEIRRVLKDGGRLALSTWKILEDMEWMASFLNKYQPTDTKDHYHRDTPEELKTLLGEAGFTDITIITESQEFAYKDEEQWWADMRESGWKDHLKTLEESGHTLEAFKKEAFEGLQKYKRSDRFPFTVAVRFGFGTK
jgi:ubiquinone/menaquinone biosynthesis C-methylase UbiE